MDCFPPFKIHMASGLNYCSQNGEKSLCCGHLISGQSHIAFHKDDGPDAEADVMCDKQLLWIRKNVT